MISENYKKGFTLIELLVVIAIITLLSSITLAITSVARARGRDAEKIQTSHQVATALNNFYLNKGKMPGNYLNADGTYNATGTGNALAVEDIDGSSPISGQAYTASMQELVNAGYLTGVPHSSGGQPYAYYNYGQSSLPGAVFATSLETGKPSDTGMAGSCRPFAAVNNYNPSADFDHSSIIDGGDFNIWFTHNGMTNATQSQGDANGDHVVDIGDYNIWFMSVGASTANPQFHNYCSQNVTSDFCTCVTY